MADGIFTRLVRNSEVPEGQSEVTGCWRWTARISQGNRSTQYPRMNLQVYGKRVTVAAHRAAAVLKDPAAIDPSPVDVYFTLVLWALAEIEADHGCDESLCVNLDHLTPLSKDQHLERTRDRGQSFWRKAA